MIMRKMLYGEIGVTRSFNKDRVLLSVREGEGLARIMMTIDQALNLAKELAISAKDAKKDIRRHSRRHSNG